MRRVKISERIIYVGVNDRKKHLFENNWPLPNGVAYNSYLINDEKKVLIDTLEYGSNSDYLDEINNELNGKTLDYLVMNHMEPDHASMIGEVLKRYPQLKVVGNDKTFNMLQSYYNLTESNFHKVADGDTLDLGHHKLTFVITPWVHWPETMMTYDATDKILFSCDAFGSFGTLDGAIFDDEANFDFYESEMRRYYSNIVGKYSLMVQKALAKLQGTEVKTIAPSHGLIWRSDPAKVIGLYDKWSRHEAEDGIVLAYASMYGNTEKMADYIARTIAERGVKNIRIYDVSKTHPSYIVSDLWKYKGFILGTCAYNGDMHPMMSNLTHEISVLMPQKKVVGLFGSSTWNGAGVKALKSWSETAKQTPIEQVVEISGGMSDEKISEAAEAFADAFVEQLRKQ